MSWNRFSVLVVQHGETPSVWRAHDGTAAWTFSHASRKARMLIRRNKFRLVEIVPAKDEDVSDWQKTEFANRVSLHNRSSSVAAAESDESKVMSRKSAAKRQTDGE